MKDEAAANADADNKAKEEIEKLNAADALVFSTEKQIKEYGDKIPEDKKKAIQDACDKLKTAHAEKDFAAIEIASTELNEAWNAASQDLYAATQNQQTPPTEEANTNSNSNSDKNAEVTDVDFEEVK